MFRAYRADCRECAVIGGHGPSARRGRRASSLDGAMRPASRRRQQGRILDHQRGFERVARFLGPHERASRRPEPRSRKRPPIRPADRAAPAAAGAGRCVLRTVRREKIDLDRAVAIDHAHGALARLGDAAREQVDARPVLEGRAWPTTSSGNRPCTERAGGAHRGNARREPGGGRDRDRGSSDRARRRHRCPCPSRDRRGRIRRTSGASSQSSSPLWAKTKRS